MSVKNISGHDRCRDHVILEVLARALHRDSAKNPEKILSEVLFCLHANTTCSVAVDKCLYLNVNESRAFQIAAQNVSIGGITHRYHRREAPTAKLARHKELAGISATAFLFLRHDDSKGLPSGLSERGQRQGGLVFRRTALRCPWFAPKGVAHAF